MRDALHVHRITQSAIMRAAFQVTGRLIHQSQLSKIVNGRVRPTVTEAKRIRSALLQLGLAPDVVASITELSP